MQESARPQACVLGRGWYSVRLGGRASWRSVRWGMRGLREWSVGVVKAEVSPDTTVGD